MRGAIAWAFTAFQPEAPFELETRVGELKRYQTAPEVAHAIREGELAPEPRFPVKAKLRPLVFLQDRPRAVLPEYAALKTARFSKLDAQAQERVRRHEEPALYHLPGNPGKYGLKQENAIDLNSVVRVHATALATGPIGYLDEYEIDMVGRQLAEFLDIDLGPAIREGVIARWEQLVEAQKGREL